VVESETDFVARNEDFIAIAQSIAEKVRDGVSHESEEIKNIVESAVAKIREHIKVTRAERVQSENGIATYVHHDRTKGAVIVPAKGEGSHEAMKKVAIQAVAYPPQVVRKDQLSQEKLDAEIATETQRAMNEGKPENIARNIAEGRVNKEYIKSAVLLEQPFYLDPSKSVMQYLTESAPGSEIQDALYLAVGQAGQTL